MGESRDAPYGVRIGDEVLTEGATGRQPVSLEQPGNVASRMGHQVTLTGIGASIKSDSFTNTLWCNTMAMPGGTSVE